MRPSHRAAWIVRAAFFLFSLGFAILLRPFGPSLPYSACFAAFLVLASLLVEQGLRRAPFPPVVIGTAGLTAGLCLGALVINIFGFAIPGAVGAFVRLFLPLCTGFLGLSVGLANAHSFDFITHHLFRNDSQASTSTTRYLDTSALIDGRIADIAETGFLPGVYVIPQFVLNELQTVADCADSAKRSRGRRGLDVVARLQKALGIRVEISPADYADIRGVDWKLIEAAKGRHAQIVTTDFNLSKLAQVQGIHVLNVHELANALRPVVLPGETMRVFIAREGKEPAQGIGYLDDGTMVVVENARRQMAKTVDIIVTGVVQNAAGKMMFGKYEPPAKGGSSHSATSFTRPSDSELS